MSEMGKTMVDAVVDLRAFQECMRPPAALKGKQAAFDVLNSFGSEVSRSHDCCASSSRRNKPRTSSATSTRWLCASRTWPSGMSAVGNPEQHVAAGGWHGE